MTTPEDDAPRPDVLRPDVPPDATADATPDVAADATAALGTGVPDATSVLGPVDVGAPDTASDEDPDTASAEAPAPSGPVPAPPTVEPPAALAPEPADEPAGEAPDPPTAEPTAEPTTTLATAPTAPTGDAPRDPFAPTGDVVAGTPASADAGPPLAPAAVTVPPVDVDPGTGVPDAAPVPPPAGPVVDEPAPTADRPRRSVLPLVLVGLLTLALLAGTAFLGYRLRQEQLTSQARDEATAASRDAARLLFSYDHATLDEDFAKGLAVTTGDFTESYRKTTTEVVKPVALQYKAVVVADVVESAVIEAEPHEVTTLVFLNQGTTSTRVTGQQVDQSRVRMRLVEKDGRWLVSEVTAL